MAQTSIPAGSALSRKVFGAALFSKVVEVNGFVKTLTGPAPKQAEAEANLKGQTSAGMPIIRVTDLQKSAGDTVSVDCFDSISGKPLMGDVNGEGKGEALSNSSMDIAIDNTTKVVDAGGKMSQKRTIHELRGIAMSQLIGYFPRLDVQRAIVHLAGARGTMTGKDWIIPTASDSDFSGIMVNSVKAPTYNRHFVLDGSALVQGGAQLGSIDSTDVWTLEHIDAISLMLSDLQMPLQPVKVADDPAADDEPIKGILYLSERQWAQIGTSSTYRTALQNAWARKSYGSKHPLFSGEPILWNGILVRKLPKYCIRFLPGDTAKVITAANRYTATESDQTVNASLTSGYAVDRAILVGAQALGYVYGANAQSGTGFAWLERKYNFERNLEVAGESMGGMSKLRFSFDDGSGNKEPTDNGVFVFDSAVKL